ncbi:hypothetical protein BKA69DRAFT_1057099, partial [Paraphysoderma sedebokerense]
SLGHFDTIQLLTFYFIDSFTSVAKNWLYEDYCISEFLYPIVIPSCTKSKQHRGRVDDDQFSILNISQNRFGLSIDFHQRRWRHRFGLNPFFKSDDKNDVSLHKECPHRLPPDIRKLCNSGLLTLQTNTNAHIIFMIFSLCQIENIYLIGLFIGSNTAWKLRILSTINEPNVLAFPTDVSILNLSTGISLRSCTLEKCKYIQQDDF